MAETPKTFDPYEYVAVIAPGAVVSLGLIAAVPELKAWLGDKLSLGEFGIFLIVSFAVGHGVQALGNLWEALLWGLFGRPTDKVRLPGQTLLSPDERRALQISVADMEGRDLALDQISVRQWRLVVMRAYSRVSAAGAAERIDAFNRTYGLLRGLSVAFLLLGGWLLIVRAEPRLIGIAFVFSATLTYRMFRFSVHYARALFLRFVDLTTGGSEVKSAA